MVKNLTELSKEIAGEVEGLSQAQALKICKSVFKKVSNSLFECREGGARVAIAEFGNFSVRKVSARKVRNIKTGEIVDFPESYRVAFRPAQALKDTVINGPSEEPEAEPAPKKEAPKKSKKSEDISNDEIPDLSKL